MEATKEGPDGFLLDTKGLCFLCLEEVGDEGASNRCSFAKLSRYIKIDFPSILQSLSVPVQSNGLLESSELFVSLCDACHSEAQRFAKFYQELDLIKLQLTSCVASIQKSIEKSFRNPRLVGAHNEKLEGEELQAEIISKLREETNKSCLEHVRKHFPTVVITQLDPLSIPSPASLSPPEGHPEPDEIKIEVEEFEENDFEAPTAEDQTSSQADISFLVGPNSKKGRHLDPQSPKLYPCRKCGKNFTHKKLQIHRKRGCKIHRRSRQVQPAECVHCHLKYTSDYNLKLHLSNTHFEVPFLPLKKPELSQKLFRALVDLQHNSVTQRRPHTKKQKWHGHECLYCGHVSQDKGPHRRHLMRAHFHEISQDVVEMQEKHPLQLIESHARDLSRPKRGRKWLRPPRQFSAPPKHKAKPNEEVRKAENVSKFREETNKSCLEHVQKQFPTVAIPQPDPLSVPSQPPEAGPPEPAEVKMEIEELDENEPKAPPNEHPPQPPVDISFLVDLNSRKDPDPDEGSAQGLQMYPCRTCGKHFLHKYLAAHRARGCGIRRYRSLRITECVHCHLRFKKPHSFNLHLSNHHFELPFLPLKNPKLSEKLFRALVDLQLNSVTQRMPLPNYKRECYECLYCGHVSKSKALHRRHLSRAHFDEISQDVVEIQKKPPVKLIKGHAHDLSRPKPGRRLKPPSPNCPPPDEERAGLNGDAFQNRICDKCHIAMESWEDFKNHWKCRSTAEVLKMAFSAKSTTPLTASTSPSEQAPPPDILPERASPVISCTHPDCLVILPSKEARKVHILLQHPPSSLQKSDFKCDFCLKKFRHFFAFRIHLLTTHRVQMLTPFAPRRTKPDDLETTVDQIIGRLTAEEVEDSDGVKKKCSFCGKLFKKPSEAETHVVLTHFDEVATFLQDALDGNKFIPRGDLETVQNLDFIPVPEEFRGNQHDGQQQDPFLENGDVKSEPTEFLQDPLLI